MTRLMKRLGVLIPIVAACGGTAVVDDPLGGGGAGGDSASTSEAVAVGATGTSGGATVGGSGSASTGSANAASGSTGSVAPAGSTGSGMPNQCGPKPETCADACSALWCCSFSAGLCPGLDADDEKGFVVGCVEACKQTAAIIGLVDPVDCATTVKTIAGINGDFARVCFGG